AHGLGGHGEHAAKLAAAENAEHGRRQDGLAGCHHSTSGRVIASTVSRCSVRKALSRSRSAGISLASRATAKRPALAAPASPMAKVATGMPLGICTMESRESSPRRYLDGTGTPSTGTVVLAASMPGRWAAPPAPAMMALRPRDSAASAYSYS